QLYPLSLHDALPIWAVQPPGWRVLIERAPTDCLRAVMWGPCRSALWRTEHERPPLAHRPRLAPWPAARAADDGGRRGGFSRMRADRKSTRLNSSHVK